LRENPPTGDQTKAYGGKKEPPETTLHALHNAKISGFGKRYIDVQTSSEIPFWQIKS
jgi:hypothetical protein